MGAGNAFNTGNVAMAFTHLWYTGIVRDEEGNGREFFDIAPVPEYDGEATAKLHADTFRILDSSENPEAAFEVLAYLLDTGAPVLLDTYGGMPARSDLRDPFFAQLDEVFPQGVNWQVAEDGLERPDVPSHESNMPNFDEAEAVIDELEDRLTTEPGLDVAAAAEELRVGARRRCSPALRLRRAGDRTSGQRSPPEPSPPTRRRRRRRAEGPTDAGARR